MIAILETACGCRKEMSVDDFAPFIDVPLRHDLVPSCVKDFNILTTVRLCSLQRRFELKSRHENVAGRILLYYKEVSPSSVCPPDR
jgi:hypothetical protein